VRAGLLGILGLAFGLRLAWVVLVPNEQYSDSVWYDATAAHLAATGEYGPDGPSAWFPPGYPFFLAAIYRSLGYWQLAGKLGNVLVGTAIVLLTYLLARRLVGQRGALVAALLVAVWPNLVFHTGILSSDLLATCGFLLSLWLASRLPGEGGHRLPLLLLLGLVIGWTVLVRPVSLILLPAIGLWWWIGARALTPPLHWIAPVVAVVFVVIGAWTVRNYVRFGEAIPIATNGGYNFWQVNQRYADGTDTYWRFVPMDDPEYQTMRNGDEFTKNREGYRYGLAFLRAHPDRFFTLIPDKIFWLWHSDTSGFYEGALYPQMQGPSAVHDWIVAHERLTESLTFRWYEVVGGLALLGAALALATRRVDVWPLLLLPVLLTGFHLFFHAKDRFHLPIDPFIGIVAAYALCHIARLVARQQRLLPAAAFGDHGALRPPGPRALRPEESPRGD
jgi:4-amino-4-deoxy-L-arabinose transferase-like glycosyltransferase